MLRLEEDNYGCGYILIDEYTGEDILIQIDYDYTRIASMLGWIPCKKCRFTDGTINCSHRTVDEMIKEAREYLDNHIGDTIDSTLYF